MYAVILDYSMVLGVFDDATKAYKAREEVEKRTHHEYAVIVRPVEVNNIAWFKLGIDEGR